MSNLRKTDTKIRFLMNATESPTYSNHQMQAYKSNCPPGASPMSTLALNLSDTKLDNSPSLSDLPRRRLSLTLSEGTPTKSDGVIVPTVVLDRKSSLDENKKRLLKNTSARFGGSPKETTLSRPRNVLRRIDLMPVTGNDENVHPAFATPYNAEPPLAAAAPTLQDLTASSPSKFAMMRHKQLSPSRQRQPLEDYDPNSQDSGYGADKCDAKTGFRFAEPLGLAPRRQLTDQSPRKENSNSPRSKSACQVQPPKLFNGHSLGSSSSESLDDGFIEFFDYDKCGEDANLPPAINGLFDQPLYITDGSSSQSTARLAEKGRPTFRQSLSMVETGTPNSSRARSCLFGNSPTQQGVTTGECGRPFKRPDPPCEYTSGLAKRRKSTPFHEVCDNIIVGSENSFPKAFFQKPVAKQNRCFAEAEATIMTALHRSSQEPDLIGDFSMPYLLPLMDGRHQDLKTISHDVLAQLVEGRFSEEIDSFTIVDCRYPYEFDGGHIKGAKNIYTREQLLQNFVDTSKAVAPSEASSVVKRKHIMVFHCEFSSERGPNLYRYLRNIDREENKECYPSLYYPELYLLNGGYKLFYENHGALCEPQAYRPMLHPNHEMELRVFRAKSKSWSGDSKSRLALRNNLKRLGL